MILVNEFIQLNVTADFWEMFRVVIQLGAIIAVVVIFWHKIFPFSFKRGEFHIKKDIFTLWYKIILATIPAALIGIPLDDWMDEHLYNYQVVAIALIVYGAWFIFLEKKNTNQDFAIKDVSQLSYKVALGIGFFQVLSLVPGTSRSGSTIIGGMLLGTSRTVAAEFTFYLAIPVMFGASLIKLLKFGFVFSASEIGIMILGMLTAFLVSLVSIRFLMRYVKTHDFKLFGIYRIVLGIVVLFYFFFR
jgi:undecaprenyl-diphosphatase